ncbi:hypothetical protein CEUSTIGMA_g5905.t1 [Chlamydomonas eustigma]|uniref:Mannose-P-dolichol utilization defect 1 protein homolog n=1 Tax=Chlamydomonas eustigma TaxID=1157962 RepID=A0A250X600_9CHLO|nr:hypothetical protein CEUSTIGMA_g5905.t1 [Chlamydomonas eustigma]|eukprot:GAX78466.1 hypothetical protein CEUSTIGMA_g5905.t1 [Chlamydomonas eustigma]
MSLSVFFPLLLPLMASAQGLPAWIPPVETLKQLISSALGYGIMTGACILKVPQIKIILQNQSAAGLSVLSFELECIGLVVHWAYGYVMKLPFNSYGEALIVLTQTLLILGLVYSYGKHSAVRAIGYMTALSGFVAAVLTGDLDKPSVIAAYSVNTFILIAARVPQIWANLKNGGTGQLSFTTCFISTVGCVARVYTTIAAKAGDAMLRQFLIALLLNGTLVAQILVYGPGGRPKQPSKPAEKDKKQT